MRDPERIDKFCERLAKAWENYPDWRFGQLTLLQSPNATIRVAGLLVTLQQFRNFIIA